MRIFLFLLVIHAFPAYLLSDEKENPSIGIVTFTVGEVNFSRSGKPVKIKKKDAVYMEDEISTKTGGVDIQMTSSVIFRIGNQTKVKLKSIFESTKKDSIIIELLKGNLFSKLQKKTGKELQYQVVTPNMIAGARGTEFIVSTGEDGSSDGIPEGIYVNEGTVEVKEINREEGYSASAGEEIVKTSKGIQKQLLDDFMLEKMKLFDTLKVMKEESYKLLKEQKLKNKVLIDSDPNKKK